MIYAKNLFINFKIKLQLKVQKYPVLQQIYIHPEYAHISELIRLENIDRDTPVRVNVLASETPGNCLHFRAIKIIFVPTYVHAALHRGYPSWTGN